MQSSSNENESDVWPQIAPLLDTAMAGLSERDRHAVVLRYFDGKSMREVGAALGGSEDAAKMRVNRAVEKLRGFFTKRGVALSAAALMAAISANSVQAAPAVLAKSITAVAMTKGVAASGSTLTLVKGALKIMAWTKAKTAVVAGVAIILTASTTTMVIHHQHRPKLQPMATGQTEFQRTSFEFAGYADARSAFMSAIWAISVGDRQTLLNSLTPAEKQRQEQQMAENIRKTRKTEAQLVAQAAHNNSSKSNGFQILDQEQVAADEVILHLFIPDNPQKVDAIMRKIGNEWRLDSVKEFPVEKRGVPNQRR